MPELIRADQVAGPLIGVLRGADMNSTADQSISCAPKKFIIRRVVITNASVPLTTAAGGLYTNVNKTGVAIVPAAQSYAALTTPTKFIETALHALAATDSFVSGTIYLSLTTGHSSPVTADIYVYGDSVEG